MAAFETETVESCCSLGMDLAGQLRLVSLVEIRPHVPKADVAAQYGFRAREGWLNLLSLRGLYQASPHCRRRVPRPTLEGVREGADLLKAEQPSDLGDR